MMKEKYTRVCLFLFVGMMLMKSVPLFGKYYDGAVIECVSIDSAKQMKAEERYVKLSMLDDMNPSEQERNDIIRAMGATHTVQALSFIHKYYDNTAYNEASAESIKEIIEHDPTLNGGKTVRVMLEVAKAVYDYKRIFEASAERDYELIKELIANTKDTGYTLSTEKTKMGKNGFWNLREEFKDFDLSFDWNTCDVLTVTLRSMPLIVLDHSRGLKLAGSKEWKRYESMGRWNTANIRVVGDRLSVSINGHKLLDNVVMQNPEKGKTIKTVGYIGFGVQGDGLEVRYTRIRKLPSTTVSNTIVME